MKTESSRAQRWLFLGTLHCTNPLYVARHTESFKPVQGAGHSLVAARTRPLWRCPLAKCTAGTAGSPGEALWQAARPIQSAGACPSPLCIARRIPASAGLPTEAAAEAPGSGCDELRQTTRPAASMFLIPSVLCSFAPLQIRIVHVLLLCFFPRSLLPSSNLFNFLFRHIHQHQYPHVLSPTPLDRFRVPSPV